MSESSLAKGSKEQPEPLWIASTAALSELASQLSTVPELGIDTEFHRERTYFPRLALLQLAWQDGCALVDPISVDLTVLEPLFLSETTFIFHAFEQDLNILERACGTVPNHLYDTQIAAGFLGHSRPGLALLLERYLGVNLPKADRLSDWTTRPLSRAQLRYAASDVLHLTELKAILDRELIRTHRTHWNQEETELLASRRRDTHDPNTAWIRIKECRSLSKDGRKVAKGVAQWRETQAIAADIPVRFLLSDLAVAAIAQSKPTSRSSLESVRGVDLRRLSHQQVDAILEAVRSSLESSEVPELPQPQGIVPKGATSTVTLCLTWLSAKATAEHLDPTIAGTREEVGELLYGEQGRLTLGWRRDLFGNDLLDIRDGKVAVRVTGSGALELVQVP